MSDDARMDLLIDKVTLMAESVDAMARAEAARQERETHQKEKNESYDKFISDNTHSLYRLAKSHSRWDKFYDQYVGKFVFCIILIIGLAAGFNWLK